MTDFGDYVILSDEATKDKFKQVKTQAEFNNLFHASDDKDTSKNASHHSLGPGQTQASPGSHVHDGKESRLLSNTLNMLPVSDSDYTDYLNLVNTAYAATSTPCAITFKAPPSGKGLLICKAVLHLSVTAALARRCNSAPFLGTGTTLNAGTATAIEGIVPNSDANLDTIRFVHVENGHVQIVELDGVGSDTYLIEGLTPGNDYNAALRHTIASATNSSYDVKTQNIRWIPLL